MMAQERLRGMHRPRHPVARALLLAALVMGATNVRAEPRQDGSQLSGLDRQLLDTPAARLSHPWKICTAAWSPMASCSPGGDRSLFSGYVVELFRLLAHDRGWKEGDGPDAAGADWYLECLEYSAVMDDLSSPAGGCAVAAAGVAVTSRAMQSQQFKFSWPIYKARHRQGNGSGLRILIHSHVQAGGTWAFAAAFHWTLWVASGSTAMLVGVIIAVVERVSLGPRANPKGVGGWIWATWAKMMFVPASVGDPQTWASRIILMGYAFLVMALLFMYTAISASNLTDTALKGVRVRSKAELSKPGVRVDTWTGYTGILQAHHSVTAVGNAWEDDADTDNMVARLRDEHTDALVLDKSIVEHIAGTNEACDLFVMGEVFETFSLALAFPTEFPDATIAALNEAIVRLQAQQGALDMLENTYIKTGGTDKCFGSGGGHASGAQIQLRQVSGLWYILCIATGVSLVLLAFYNVKNDPLAMVGLKQRIATSFGGNRVAHARDSSNSGRLPQLDVGGGGEGTKDGGGDDSLSHQLPLAAWGMGAGGEGDAMVRLEAKGGLGPKGGGADAAGSAGFQPAPAAWATLGGGGGGGGGGDSIGSARLRAAPELAAAAAADACGDPSSADPGEEVLVLSDPGTRAGRHNAHFA